MALSRSRTVTIVVAIATLTSNALSLLLCYQLPDDPLHLARNFGLYLHFANVLSVFGFIGALRQHALSIAIFSNYLILDTILCCIPRFLVLALLHSLSGSLCAPPSSPQTAPPNQQPNFSTASTLVAANTSPLISNSAYTPSLSVPTLSCEKFVLLAQLTLAAGVVAGTILQFVGALQVREYARVLFVKECLEEDERRIEGGFADEDGVVEERVFGLPVIYEDLARERFMPTDSKV